MIRAKREKRKLNQLLNKLEEYERSTLPNRGFQLAIEEIINIFNIKYDEFPVMKKLVIDSNHGVGTNKYMLFRWMPMNSSCLSCMGLAIEGGYR